MNRSVFRFTSLSACLFVFAQLTAQQITHTELLGRPTDKEITLQVAFADSAEACVNYGTTAGNLTQQTPWQTMRIGDPTEITIGNLTANKQYYYQLLYRKPNTTAVTKRPEYSFHTQRPANQGFTFVVQADPHLDALSDTNVYKRCLQNQLEDKPDFMIDLGDIIMTDKLVRAGSKVVTHDTIIYRNHLMRRYYESITHSVPLFIAIGNHEAENGWYLNGTASNMAVWGSNERNKYFINPKPDNFYTGDTASYPFVGQRKSYYSWTWGDALFIVLDPYFHTKVKPDSLNGWRWTLGKAQYDWLRTTLESSSAKYKFVFSHQLVGGDKDGRGGVEPADKYEWGGNNLDGTRGFETQRPGWYKPIKDLLTDHRVTIFFHGHDHFFGKQQKECLVYQETPQPSHPNYSTVNYAENYGYFQGQILPNSGHLRVTVAPEGVKVDYVRVYKSSVETATRKNKDVSATYFIGAINCYDSLNSNSPVVWNSDYVQEWIQPNPSPGETLLRFQIHYNEPINLQIFDAQGRLVRNLLNQNTLQQGEFAVVWDGCNALGSPLPNGTYTYCLKGQSHGERCGKIILNRP
ncbi:MAG: metallophosphoesterase [Bacteroidota bacterium]